MDLYFLPVIFLIDSQNVIDNNVDVTTILRFILKQYLLLFQAFVATIIQ